MYAEHIFTCRTTSPSLPSMRPYGIVKAIRTSSPPRRVSIGAVAVAADEPLPSPLTLDVLFACLPSCAFLLGIKIGYCAKLQTSYNSHFSFLYCDRPPSLRSSILSLAWHLQISPDALTMQEFPALLRRERSVVDRTSWLIYFFHTISPPFRKISETHALPLLGSLLFHPCATDTSRSKKFVRLA